MRNSSPLTQRSTTLTPALASSTSMASAPAAPHTDERYQPHQLKWLSNHWTKPRRAYASAYHIDVSQCGCAMSTSSAKPGSRNPARNMASSYWRRDGDWLIEYNVERGSRLAISAAALYLVTTSGCVGAHHTLGETTGRVAPKRVENRTRGICWDDKLVGEPSAFFYPHAARRFTPGSGSK